MLNFKFSILMANYNNAKFIKEAIDSVISQTNNNWELIIVDDNSTDNSIDIIKPYLNDKRIKLIKHKTNHGYGASLKTAAAHSKMNVLVILDADDKFSKEALEILATEYLKNPEIGFIYSNMWECDSLLNPIKISTWIGPDIPPKTNIFKPKVSHLKSFLKELYLKTTGFDPKLKIAVDRDIIFKMEEITNFKFINKPLYYYRIHESGVSQGKKRFQGRIEFYVTLCKAYQRRINTDIPNLPLRYLYNEYFKITFHKMILFIIKLIKYTQINIFIKKISRKSTLIKNLVQNNKILKILLFQFN